MTATVAVTGGCVCPHPSPPELLVRGPVGRKGGLSEALGTSLSGKARAATRQLDAVPLSRAARVTRSLPAPCRLPVNNTHWSCTLQDAGRASYCFIFFIFLKYSQALLVCSFFSIKIFF